MDTEKSHSSARIGTCKLTQSTGPLVKSHLLPEALTRPSTPGSPLYQYGEGPTPKRRWTSWYDSELVTEAGERYLSELDDWAIRILREKKLIWSGWGHAKSLGALHAPINEAIGARLVAGLNTQKLRMFFHSLLWRAAASDRYEFAEISLAENDLEMLRLAILGEEVLPLSFFPVQLTQLSTKGAIHNQTPIQDAKYIPHPLVPNSEIALPTYRFYLDGLVAHIHRTFPLGYDVEALGNLLIGADSDILVSTVTYEDSKQAHDLESTKKAYGI